MKKLGVAAALMLCAFGASASNFRGADQVYIPIAAHAGGASGTFISDVYISNLTSDDVDVSVLFQPGGEGGGPGQEFKNVISLRPNERKEYLDFFKSALGITNNVAGLVIFNGCKKNSAGCGEDQQDTQTGISANFRAISVESRIYVIPGEGAGLPPANTRQNGQLFSGIPWYNFVSSLQSNSGLDKVFITGITQTGGPGQVGTYRTNIGVVNASQFSRTTLKLTLYQNTLDAAGKKKEVTVDLGPLGSTGAKGLGDWFGKDSNGNDLFTGSNYFVVVEQTNSTAESPGNGITVPAACGGQGCPAFLAF
ncbi:MAG TPA: hypothetical protein VI670_07440, partial [Thermoanaerobaculia bacterium]